MSDEVGCVGFAPVVTVQSLEEHLRATGLLKEILVGPESSVVPHWNGENYIVPIPSTEQLKYEQMWKFDAYRAVAPGEGVAENFIKVALPKQGSEVIDFGAGTGRGALMLAIMGGMRVHMLDFAENCLDEDVRNALTTQSHVLSFEKHDLTKPITRSAQYGYCTDVMEHIPPDEVNRVLQNILQSAQHVFFQISCEEDNCGALIGQPLHLSIHPYAWWLTKLQEFGAAVHWSFDGGTHCMFYVTAWSKGSDIVNIGVLNVEEQQCIENVKVNIKNGWQQVQPHLTNDIEVMILAGGPSLNDYTADIKRLRSEGVKLITLNGTYNWALEQGLTPSAQIIVDAREFNARFTKPVVDDCKYIIASQCHPSVFEGLPHDRTYIWHTSAEMIKDVLKEHYDIWFYIPGGSTVMLRAIPLLRLLGFRRFHLFGFDSCLRSDYFDSRCYGCSCDASPKSLEACPRSHVTQKHHAYAQPENDQAMVIDTIVAGRIFKCHAWMVSQGQEFMDLIKFLGDEIELEIYGDGLIAHILRTGAELADEQGEEQEPTAFTEVVLK